MDFKLEHDVDKGPIVRWFANQAMNISGWLAKTSAPYADMYTAVWDDYEEDEDPEGDLTKEDVVEIIKRKKSNRLH